MASIDSWYVFEFGWLIMFDNLECLTLRVYVCRQQGLWYLILIIHLGPAHVAQIGVLIANWRIWEYGPLIGRGSEIVNMRVKKGICVNIRASLTPLHSASMYICLSLHSASASIYVCLSLYSASRYMRLSLHSASSKQSWADELNFAKFSTRSSVTE